MTLVGQAPGYITNQHVPERLNFKLCFLVSFRIAVFMVSTLNISQRTSGSCPRSFSPKTAFGLQNRRRDSCHMLVFTWQPSISGCRSSGIERITAQRHLHTISLFIPATSENFSVSATTASIILITVSWSWCAYIQHHVNLRVCELNWTDADTAGDFAGTSESP